MGSPFGRVSASVNSASQLATTMIEPRPIARYRPRQEEQQVLAERRLILTVAVDPAELAEAFDQRRAKLRYVASAVVEHPHARWKPYPLARTAGTLFHTGAPWRA